MVIVLHIFISLYLQIGHRKLTTQINVAGDPYTYDDFAYATREGLVGDAIEHTDAAAIQANGVEGPFAEWYLTSDLAAL